MNMSTRSSTSFCSSSLIHQWLARFEADSWGNCLYVNFFPRFFCGDFNRKSSTVSLFGKLLFVGGLDMQVVLRG